MALPFTATRISRSLRRTLALSVLGVLVLNTSACDEGGPIRRAFSGDPTVSRWTRDSLLLASNPEVLFRVVPDAGGALVVPIGTIGAQGIRPLKLSSRGWRRVDASFMHAGKTLTPYGENRAQTEMRMFRGMWQPGVAALDSLNCPVVVPMGRSLLTGSVDTRLPPFATNGKRPPLKYGPTLDQAEIARALANVATLVAPAAGVGASQLPRYERRVHQIPTGINGGSSLLVEYNDRTPLPDSVRSYGERPRQLIVILDKGTYGYRPTYTFSTVGNRGTAPRVEFLDYLDVDNDGVPEIFFGLSQRELAPLFTTALRFENDAWREVFRFTGNRCDF
jgi:hypothetical protein